MNNIKPNEPFCSENELIAYEKYKYENNYIKYKGEDVLISFKDTYKDVQTTQTVKPLIKDLENVKTSNI